MGIRVNDVSLLEELPRHYPPGWQPAVAPVVDELYSFIGGPSEPTSTFRHYNVLYTGATLLARTRALDEALAALASDLRLGVAVRARRKLFVRAGVVGWQGRAIIIPGRSGSGTTTLVTALIRAGAVYYSDQYAVLDERGRVHPFPTPLASQEPTEQLVDAHNGGVAAKPVPVGLILATAYRPGARWRPRRLSPAEMVLVLLDNAAVARERPGFALAMLRRVVPGAVAWRGRRGEAAGVVRAILGRAPAALGSDCAPAPE